jgi:hypothetical protein
LGICLHFPFEENKMLENLSKGSKSILSTGHSFNLIYPIVDFALELHSIFDRTRASRLDRDITAI